MAKKYADRVQEVTTTTGTDPFALGGAVAGFQTFGSPMAVGDTCDYAAFAVDGDGVPTGDWETGLGTYSAASTLTRTTVQESSNGNAAVNFAAGTKRVYMSLNSTSLLALIAAAAAGGGGGGGAGGTVEFNDFGADSNYGDSSSNFSAKGSTFTAVEAMTLTGATAMVNADAEPHVAYLVSLTNQDINQVLATSAAVTPTAGKQAMVFHFPAPVDIAAGSRFGIIIARTDAVGSVSLKVQNPSTGWFPTRAPVNNDGFNSFNVAIANGTASANSGTGIGQGFAIGLRTQATVAGGGGGGGGSAVAQKFRYYVLSNFTNQADAASLSRIQFKDETGAFLPNPTIIQDGVSGVSYPFSNALNSGAGANFFSTYAGNPNGAIILDFGEAVTISAIVCTNRTDGSPQQAPTSFTIAATDVGIDFSLPLGTAVFSYAGWTGTNVVRTTNIMTVVSGGTGGGGGGGTGTVSIGAHRYWEFGILQPGDTGGGLVWGQAVFTDTAGTAHVPTASYDSNNTTDTANIYDGGPGGAGGSNWDHGYTGRDQWVVFDFGAPITMGSFTILHRQDYNGGYAQSPARFSLRYSDDKIVWTTVGVVFEAQPPYANNNDTRTFTVPQTILIGSGGSGGAAAPTVVQDASARSGSGSDSSITPTFGANTTVGNAVLMLVAGWKPGVSMPGGFDYYAADAGNLSSNQGVYALVKGVLAAATGYEVDFNGPNGRMNAYAVELDGLTRTSFRPFIPGISGSQMVGMMFGEKGALNYLILETDTDGGAVTAQSAGLTKVADLNSGGHSAAVFKVDDSAIGKAFSVTFTNAPSSGGVIGAMVSAYA